MFKINNSKILLIFFIAATLLSLSCSEEPTEPPDDNNGGVEPPYEGKIVFSSRRDGSETCIDVSKSGSIKLEYQLK